jgi:anti-sigma factor RsiW
MANCEEIEASLAAYVEGQCAPAERAGVDAHLGACPPCRARVASERVTHELLRARCRDLRGRAPAALRERCAAQRALSAGRSAMSSRRPWVPLSVAATLVLATSAVFLFGWGSTVETYAAQLAADHIKCFQFPPAAAVADVDAIGRDWQAAHGWPLKVAPASAPEHLELLGVRRCASTEGRVAHVLYRWRGEPLSLYVLNDLIEHVPEGTGEPMAHEAVRKLGEQEIIWSQGGRTYAVVARAPIEELQQVARYVRLRVNE